MNMRFIIRCTGKKYKQHILEVSPEISIRTQFSDFSRSPKIYTTFIKNEKKNFHRKLFGFLFFQIKLCQCQSESSKINLIKINHST